MTFKLASRSSGAFDPIVTPTMVQVVGSNLNDNNGINGNGYVFNMPNLTLAGNCLVLAIAYPYKSGRTISISDSAGDTWPSSAIATGTQSLTNLNVSIFVLPNASAALHKITVTFDAAIRVFQYTMCEFYNVASAAPVDGTQGASSSASPNVAAGSFTPNTNNDAVGGHLIFNYAISNDTIGTNASNKASALSATNSAKLLHANNVCTIPSVSSYGVQTTNGAINPGFSITQSSGTNFVCASVALKAGFAGTAPAAGIRIIRLLHYSPEAPTTSDVFTFPCDGNLLVATMAAGSNLNQVNGVTDSNGQTYTNPGTAGNCQVFYHQNATPSNALTLAVALNASEIQYSIHLFDIIGANPSAFDNTHGFNGAAPGSGNVCNDLPDITPNSAPGLTIAITGFGTGPTTGLAAGAPAGAIYDLVFYTGMTDADQMDNADGFGHVYHQTTAAQTWNWAIDTAARGSTAFATAVCFK